MQNRDVLLHDPLTTDIPNDGVTVVGQPRDDKSWAVLRYELRQFVCTGTFEDGLERILRSFLGHIDRERQPAAWVSGFYGSGKSHFVRVLEHLWRDDALDDGASARSTATLPSDVEDLLKQLSTEGVRAGGLWSAAGKLGAGAQGSFKKQLLGVLFDAADLPTIYPAAKFALWLHDEGAWDGFTAALAARGTDLRSLQERIYVSTDIAQALLEVRPQLASSEAGVHLLLREQFRNDPDIDDGEFVNVARSVLRLNGRDNKLPYTLVVLDEVQQFIAEDPRTALGVQDVVELICSAMGSQILIVATGQSALTESAVLARFRDRFTVPVQLSSADVETVVRRVILQKKPEHEAALRVELDNVSGEIHRQLRGTRIAPVDADRARIISDYPILPARWRFWEHTLRAIDTGGRDGLRSQLRMTHEAVKRIVERDVPVAAPADTIYDDHVSYLLNAAILPRGVHEAIERLRVGHDEERLQARVLALTFLISKLPREAVADIGVRATSEALVDLLVEDLRTDQATLRERIPAAVESLLGDGLVQEIGGELRTQTPESQEWERDFRRYEAKLRGDTLGVATERQARLHDQFQRAAKTLAITQGASGERRTAVPHYGTAQPSAEGLVIWIRDGWEIDEATVRSDAASAGQDSPTVFVFISADHRDEIRDWIATILAAQEVLDDRAGGQTAEANEARAGMVSRRDDAGDRLRASLAGLVERALILQGGGADVGGGDVQTRIANALRAAAARLYNRFTEADHQKWGSVLRRAQQGNLDALREIGHDADPAAHSVCRAILDASPAGIKGGELLRRLQGPGYGWPQDAIVACVAVLLASGAVTVRQNNVELRVGDFSSGKLRSSDIRASTSTPAGMQEKLAVRGLMQVVGMDGSVDPTPEQTTALIDRLIESAKTAGGDAPLPDAPSTSGLSNIRDTDPNDRARALAGLAPSIKTDLAGWANRRALITERLPRWALLLRLQRSASVLAIADEVAPSIEAILRDRSLLSEPDPALPLISTLESALRAEFRLIAEEITERRARARATLEADPDWAKTDEPTRITIGTPFLAEDIVAPATADGLADSLGDVSLASLREKAAAVDGHLKRARTALATAVEPDVTEVQLPARTLRDAPEVEAYVKEVEALLLKLIADGPVVPRG